MAVASTHLTNIPPTMASPPRTGSVLIVGNFLSRSNGNRSVCEDLAERLPGQGWQVATTSHHPGRLRRFFDMLATAWRRRAHYGMAQIDLFSGPAFFWAAAVCGLLHLIDKPYILTLHGGALPAFGRRWPRLMRKVLQSAAVVTAPSRYLFEEMREFRHDIQVLPNAITLSHYPFVHRNSARPRLIWVRAFHKIYQPDLAIRVLARLEERFPDIQMTMIGPDKDGSLETSKALAEQLGVDHRIQFLGRVPKSEIARWINSGDIFMNTSAIDNTPVTVVEAMACGSCVVSTEVGGIPYLCSHGVDAMLSPATDAKAMAVNIAEILSKPSLASALSSKARGRAELMDWSAILPRWSSLLRGVSQPSNSVRKEKL